MNKLTDATVFSKTYTIPFDKELTKPAVEKLVRRLVLDVGSPLSHNGIIVGHIKVLAKLSAEEFIFVSLTRLDRVDVKFSAQWPVDAERGFTRFDLDVNVLVFGYEEAAIAKAVDAALAVLRQSNLYEE
ncbi:hypothetical protein [Sporomusa termitida]|uniref:Uncharacterized protein n=1 Tax=Sporomusa termitida TaxID=2377 RepID=A0A517DVQ5_9FIRM|nr:hypothetical protein [Sporomusa termitida]QDR81421.1 hypothetical protein SPTER_28010 [Sporomusa termitida]